MSDPLLHFAEFMSGRLRKRCGSAKPLAWTSDTGKVSCERCQSLIAKDRKEAMVTLAKARATLTKLDPIGDCECDNGHRQNDTVCMPCYRAGYRTWVERWGTYP